MSDAEFLSWIYNRLLYKYHEDPLFDYMHRFQEIIKKCEYMEKMEET